MNYEDLVYFDIETAGNYKDLNSLKSNDIRGYELFMRKIERKSENFTDWKLDDINEIYINKAPLMPEFGRVVCVSVATIIKNKLKIVSLCDENEQAIINNAQKIFTSVSNKTILGISGFYIKGFDIPWLNRKFLQYNLEIPKVMQTFNKKPWEMNVVDLSEVWKNFGTLEHVSFDEMLYLLNIPSPKSIITGKDVHYNFWIAKDLEKIKVYCESDVIACIETAKKIIHLIA
jgi:3'-5' exonuclease